MNGKPILSIVMPIFNHSPQVRTMIDSIILNSFRDWELIAVDDGSDEETLRVLTQYAADDARIRIIRRDRLPKGAPTCRNIGFGMARGEYTVFFDSDDYVTPSCLETRVKCIAGRPDLDFLVFPSGIYNEKGFHAEPHLFAFGYPVYKDDVEHFARRLLPFIVWNNIYRTEALRRSGVTWDEALLSLQDADFNVQTLVAGMRYDYARKCPDYGYRSSTTSSITKGMRTIEHSKSTVYAMRKMYLTVRTKYGSRYDKALLYGLFRMYNSIVTGQGVNPQLTQLFVEGLRDVAPAHTRKLQRKTTLSIALRRVLPVLSPKTARQLSMLPFLMEHSRRQKCKLAAMERLQHPSHSV